MPFQCVMRPGESVRVGGYFRIVFRGTDPDTHHPLFKFVLCLPSVSMPISAGSAFRFGVVAADDGSAEVCVDVSPPCPIEHVSQEH